MINIDGIWAEDELLEEFFFCDLDTCKGRCCEDGDAGAPLEAGDIDNIKALYQKFEPYMSPMGKAFVKENGLVIDHREYGPVTPTQPNGLCAYGIRNKAGVVKCAIEQAALAGKIDWKKPISCHLFPMILTHGRKNDSTFLRYQPRKKMCASSRELGKTKGVPVYQFLKEPLTRKFGHEWFKQLDEAYQQRERLMKIAGEK